MAEVPEGTEIVKAAGAPAQLAVSVGLMTDDEIRRMWRVAGALAESGVFKDVRDAKVAFAKMVVGRDLGLSPAQSMMGVDFVQGGIQIRGVQLLAWLREHESYDYKIMESDAKKATIRIFGFPAEEPFDGAVRYRGVWWEVLGDETFTEEQARTAQLIPDATTDGGRKAAWNAHRKNMLVWRAASNAVKFHAPDAFGGMAVYTEADSFVDGTADEISGSAHGDAGGGTQGLVLGPKVEAVLERAKRLGHAGIADRATAEMTLGGQSPAWVDRWVVNATKVLDEMEAQKGAEGEGDDDGEDATVVPGDDPPTPEDDAAAAAAVEDARDAVERTREALEAEAEALAEDAEKAAAEGDEVRAEDLRAQVATLLDEIESRFGPDVHAGQERIGL